MKKILWFVLSPVCGKDKGEATNEPSNIDVRRINFLKIRYSFFTGAILFIFLYGYQI